MARNANDHAYATPEQGAGSQAAESGTQRVIDSRLKKAADHIARGERTLALLEFGQAAHTIADRRCPAHTGYPVWSGMPEIIGTNPLHTAVNLALIWKHMQAENWDALTPELEEQIIEEIQTAFRKYIIDMSVRDIIYQRAESEAEQKYVEQVYGKR
jgi:hypothetical protein